MEGDLKQPVLGIDFGTKNIGVAVSDDLHLAAHGLKTIAARPFEGALKVLKDLVSEYNAGEMVIGLPLNMDGTSGPSADAARLFAARLEAELPVKIYLSDERLTSVMAERTLVGADVSRKKRKGLRDRLAAVLILQNFLDGRSSGS